MEDLKTLWIHRYDTGQKEEAYKWNSSRSFASVRSLPYAAAALAATNLNSFVKSFRLQKKAERRKRSASVIISVPSRKDPTVLYSLIFIWILMNSRLRFIFFFSPQFVIESREISFLFDEVNLFVLQHKRRMEAFSEKSHDLSFP